MPARINVVQRADSFRSERSDASAANKRVSFQPRVDVKHVGQQQTAFPTVYKEPTSLNEAELAKEAERIIKQVDQISCTVSPNPTIAGRLPAYETRSLERSSKRNNRQPPQQVHQEVVNSWRTLPTATKSNLLLDKQNSTKNKASKKNVLEKSTNQAVQAVLNNQNLHHHQHQHQTFEQATTSSNRDPPVRKQQPDMQPITVSGTTPPKYDSGIEMEAGGSLNRPNVNLIVQQLTEEARQRELIRRQYQEELLKLAGEAADADQVADPLAPRLPTLNLIEPDPQFGLAHNRNLPFSYTGGGSPTRLSPLRSSALRFPSPPRQQPQQQPAQQPQIDVVYAQALKTDRQQRGQSPERANNLFDRGSADKVPDKINFHHQTDVIRQHLNYKEEELDNSMDRAKARFLFGDDGQNNNNRFSSLPSKDTGEDLRAGQRYTTKIVIGDDRPAHQRIIQTASYEEDDYERKRRAYQDRSVSPEPCALPVANRVRTLERQMMEEQGGQPQQQKPQRLASTRLIQEAERGRTSFRTPRNQPQQFVNNSSRLVRQVSNVGTKHPAGVIRAEIHDTGAGTPKPPIRAKKLSRERLPGSGVTKTVFGGKTKTVPWRPDASPESSPERFIPTYQPKSSNLAYRYERERSMTPSPERVIIMNNNNAAKARPAEPEKQEKIRRQRNKFLSVFLGSRASKNAASTNNNNNSSGSSSNKSARAQQQQQPPISRWTDDEVDFARRPSTRQPTSSKTQQFRVIHHHHHSSSKDPSRRRESSYTDRTDTSESDEVHRRGQQQHQQQQRFKSQRQKSQSYNNLNYRTDPAVILPEEVPATKRYDTKPYASTNIIRRTTEIRSQEEEDEMVAPLRAPVNNNNNNVGGRPVRYFGDTDLESQQSRSYGGTRYVPRAKVMRSSSTAAGMGAVRRGVMRNGQKQPVSSVNSSESEGSAAMQSGASAESQRSVYLHATTCADIPTVVPVNKLQQARLKAKSREDMSALSGHSGSTLRQSRHISRSYSVLAPWKPRHYRDKYEISYSNQQVSPPANGPGATDAGKPPRIPRARNPSAHRDENVILEGYEPQPPLVVRQPVQQTGLSSSSGSKTANFVARSASMPKGGNSSGGNRVAGWFRSKKKQPR